MTLKLSSPFTRGFLVAFSTVLFLCTYARAQSGPPGARADTLGVDGLERGMSGFGLTVFHGTKIDTFDVEILGVLRNVFGPESDFILARLSGEMIEKTNGIAGMSGSPVYVNGKVIGAVAYGWSFSKEPIMGITPIGEMLGVIDRTHSAGTNSQMGLREGDRGVKVSFSEPGGHRSGELRRVATPVYMSGFQPEVVSELRETLRPMGLLPVQGGGGVDSALPVGELVPGAALGVQLIRGDLSMTAIGTLTYVEGDRLVGFGHPFIYTGTTALPMTSAFIHDVIPSQMESFKLGTASRTIGAITEDRAPGIAGVLGRAVDMVPTTITVRSQGDARDFDLEVLRDRNLGPMLTQASVVSALMTADRAAGEATVRTRTEFQFKGHESLVIQNVYAGLRGLGEGVLGVTRPLQILMQNPYEDVHLEEVRVELDVVSETRTARIEGVRIDRDTFYPGDRIEVTVLLQPFLHPVREIRHSLRIPRQVDDERLTLLVSSARDHAASDSKRAPGEYRLESLPHLMRRLRELERNDDLLFEFLAQKPGVTISGREVSTLPPSVRSALRLGRTSGEVQPIAQSVLLHESVRTDYVLSGSQTVYLRVGANAPGLQFGGGQRRRAPAETNKQ